MSRTTSLRRVNGPERKERCGPCAVSSTVFPEPAQLLSAAWMRVVSGGFASALSLKVRPVADSCAGRAVQTCGKCGRVTVRALPVASGAGLGTEDGEDAAAAGTINATSVTPATTVANPRLRRFAVNSLAVHRGHRLNFLPTSILLRTARP